MWLKINEGIKTSIEKKETKKVISAANNARKIILLKLLDIVRNRIESLKQSESNIIRSLNELQ